MNRTQYPLPNEGVDHLDLILATSEIGIWELDVGTGVAVRNLRHDKIFGYDFLLDKWSADIFLAHVIEEDRDRVGNLLSDAVGGTKPWEFEARIRRVDGACRWISAKGMPKFGPDGEMTKLIGHVIDITDSKATEDRLKLLTQELNHRVANTFTILNSMIRHAAKRSRSVDELAETLTQRLAALARSNRILTAQENERANLAEILQMELAAFGGWHRRISVRGNTDIWFPPETSEALAMIFHELLTNAVKYGALSLSTGQIAILITGTSDGMTVVNWEEYGGPPVSSERVQGIGTRIVAGALRDQGSVTMDFARDGLHCRIDVYGGFRRQVADGPRLADEVGPTDMVPSDQPLEGVNVLVVEDDPIIALDISETLQSYGARVIGPHFQPTTAIGAISEGPDVALLDVNLGRETSSGVAARLAEHGIPFLIVSGQMDRSELDDAFRTAPLLNKPFCDRDIVNGLMALLPRCV